MDKYELKQLNDGTLFYYKNGLLHREAGPAIIDKNDVKKFLNLEDKNLYPSTPSLINKVDYPTWDEFDLMEGVPGYYTAYYLYNENYTKEEFEKISSALKTKSELDVELPIIGIKLNKIKI